MKQGLITIAVAMVGALVELALWPHHVPLQGVVIGGTLGYGFATVVSGD